MRRPLFTVMVLIVGIGSGYCLGRTNPERRTTRTTLPLPNKVELIDTASGNRSTAYTTTAYDRDAPDLKVRMRELPGDATGPTTVQLSYPDGRIVIVNAVRIKGDEGSNDHDRVD